jgi:acetyl-CoA carboxylase biotin carboxyl carrier protein
MDIQKIEDLIKILEASEISEIEIEEDGRRIHLKKAAPDAPAQTIAYPIAAPAAAPAVPASVTAVPVEPTAVPAPQEAAAPAEHAAEDSELITIDSPMVGVFYPSPAPGEPPFASVGDTIEEDQTVCIVEAMKLMNEVTAKFRAEIVKVLVTNAEPVEFGQPLFTVRPL